ncbi:hypothetical protein BGZ73_002355 [Actinomortierella ambigua]|nr:hypothetical protein BGZ73_002355 [Actinomortierella ambigua]
MSDLIASLIDDQSLAAAVNALAQSSPEADQVLTRLLTHFQHKLQQQQQQYGSSLGEPNAKRMRLDGSTPLSSSSPSSPASSIHTTSATATSSSAPVWPLPASKDLGPAIYSTAPLSFLHPLRKKLALKFHQRELALVQSPTATSPAEVVLAAAPWTSLYRVVAVPFLERATKQTAVLLFFRHEAVPTPKDAIWAVTMADDGKDFALTCATEHLGLLDLTVDLREKVASKKPDALLVAIITRCLEVNNNLDNSNHGGYEIVASQSPPLPNFSAHLKSSQGTIYLLPKGILFAFKKPIIYLPANKIDAIGFHSIVSRTFDFEIVVSEDATPEDCEGVPPVNASTAAVSSGGNSNTSNNISNSSHLTKQQPRRTIGFGMVDTKEFAKLEEWIKRSGIRDRSMSEDLKAKDKAPISSKKRERVAEDEGGENEDDQDDEAGNDVKKTATNGVKLDKGKGKAVQQQRHEEESDDDEDDEDFAPESEDEDMVEEYDSEAIGSDQDEDEEMEAAAAPSSSTKASTSAAGSSSSRQRTVRQEEDDGESLGEDTDEDEEEDDELEDEDEDEDDNEQRVEDEDEEEKGEAHAAEDAEDEEEEEDGANNDEEDEDPAEEDEEEDLRSEEGEQMEEDDEEDEIDELEDD